MKVCIGGTFNIFHKGHEQLIDKAINSAGKNGYLFIGITEGNINKLKKNVKSFEERKKKIQSYIQNKKKIPKINIEFIKNKYGPSLKEDFDIIIVSPETIENAKEINTKRKQIGKKQLEIIQIPFVLADDGKPISSSRIAKHEINKNGLLLNRD
jgi:pantetheine-phosphate adenylyltransferase